MRLLRTTMWTVAGAMALSMWGCDVFMGGHEREERVYVQPQQLYVEPPRRAIIVEQAPPPVVEVRVR